MSYSNVSIPVNSGLDSSRLQPSQADRLLQQTAAANQQTETELQRYPALIPKEEHRPIEYAFGKVHIPATSIFFTTPLTYVSVNQSPIFPGHVLVMPRSNVQRVSSLTPIELTDLWLTAQHVAIVLEKRFEAQSMTFAIQDGVEAGQKIPCVHIHVIPRKKHDLVNKDDIYDMVNQREDNL